MSEPVKIVTRCPACGGQSLFIGDGGHLTCSRLNCSNPSAEDAVDKLKLDLGKKTMQIANARARLHHVLACCRLGDFTEAAIIRGAAEATWAELRASDGLFS